MHSANSELRRNLRSSNLDNFLFSVMVGAGESFFPAFAIALGLGGVTAGLLGSIPFLIGSTIQLAAPYLLEKVGSYRRWLVTLGVIQALTFVPLALLAYRGEKITENLLYFIVGIYWTCGLASGPAWSSWMTSLVPSKVRSKYFASRNHLGQFGLLLGLISGGFLLDIARRGGWELEAFASVFIASGMFRLGSAFFLSRKTDDPHGIRVQVKVPVREIVGRLRHATDGRLIGALLIFTAAVHLSSPFFNPFMLNQLKLSYSSYMGLIAASFVAKIVVFSAASQLSNRVNSLAFLRAGMVGAALTPVLWVISGNYVYLFFVQVLTGAIWAVFDLGAMLALFGTIRDRERTSFMSYYNFASAAMIFAGSALGGKLLSFLGTDIPTYYLLFGLSAAARFFALMLFDRATALSKVQVPTSPHDVALPLLKEASRAPVRVIGEFTRTITPLAKASIPRMRKRV